MPLLSEPKMVSLSPTHACALAEEGVVCWGGNEYGELEVPPLNNPVLVATGRNYSCALDADGVDCWGRSDLQQLEVPPQISDR